jgi:hypothetical protein
MTRAGLVFRDGEKHNAAHIALRKVEVIQLVCSERLPERVMENQAQIFATETRLHGIDMKKIIITMAFIMISLNSYAVNISLNGNHSISIDNDGDVREMKFDTVINGYNVKCSGDEIILWGKPVKMNEGNPQDTNIIIVSVSNKHKVIERGISEGIFEVAYLKNENRAYIGTGKGMFIDLGHGQLEEVGSDFDPSDDKNFESCDKNESWEFNRYN